MPPFISRRQVRFAETDMAGIVHFVNFYRWMEEAEHEFFRSLGLRIMEQLSDGDYLGWPRVSASCSFEAPARYEDEIEVRIHCERIGFKSLNYAIEIWRDSTRLAHGRLKTACCICKGDGTLESVEIPANYRQRIEDAFQA